MNQKFCPQCGHMQPGDAKICSNCGYQFKKVDQGEVDDLKVHSKKPVVQAKDSRQRKHTKVYLTAIIGLVLLVVVGFAIGQFHDRKTTEAQTVSSSQVKSSSTKTAQQSSSSSKADSSLSNLTTSLDPQQTGAATAYYGLANAGWQGIVSQDSGATIRLSTNQDLLKRLTAPGQGMVYEVYAGQNIASDTQTNYVYTIDSNGNINLYNLPADQTATNIAPVKTISRDDITKYINEHHQANDVRTLAKKVTVVEANY